MTSFNQNLWKTQALRKSSPHYPPGTGPVGTLNYLLETDPWFKDDHTIRKITEYCNKYMKENWTPGNFSGLCFRLWKNGKLIRTEVENDDILYRNSKPLE